MQYTNSSKKRNSFFQVAYSASNKYTIHGGVEVESPIKDHIRKKGGRVPASYCCHIEVDDSIFEQARLHPDLLTDGG